MTVKQFDKLFGISATVEEERIQFVNRIEQSLFVFLIDKKDNDINSYRRLIVDICYKLGEDSSKYFYATGAIKGLKYISNKDFIKTLRLIVALHECYTGYANILRTIDSCVIDALERSSVNLGIKWNNGLFYPVGDEILDKELIDVSLNLLDEFPEEKKDILLALKNSLEGNENDVVKNCYNAVEGLSRSILKNRNTIGSNKKPIMELLKFTNKWNDLFHHYIEYMHDYRHASENRHKLNPEEVEACLYLTCLFIRALIRAKKERG